MNTFALSLLAAALAAPLTPTQPATAPGSAPCCTPLAADRPLTARSLYHADATFTSDAGRATMLAQFRGRPVVVAMIFTQCSYACPLIVTDLLALQARLPEKLRRDTAFVLVSFDTARDTPAALARYRTARALDGNWTLLHGNDHAVRELAALLGVKYQPEPGGGFAHSNLFTLLNREGEVAHRRNGLKGGLDEALVALTALSP
ncbi:MAG TPA: SCO family protein [Opitutaceae bacterium]